MSDETKNTKPMYECYNCGSGNVIWDNDFEFDDFGIEEEGIVHIYHCQDCDSEIQVFTPINCKEEGNSNE